MKTKALETKKVKIASNDEIINRIESLSEEIDNRWVNHQIVHDNLSTTLEQINFSYARLEDKQKNYADFDKRISELEKMVHAKFDNIKSAIEIEKRAREKREGERESERKDRIKDRKSDFYKISGLVLSALGLGFIITGLFVTDKNQAQRDLINIRDSIQAIEINEMKDYQKEIKTDIKEILKKIK